MKSTRKLQFRKKTRQRRNKKSMKSKKSRRVRGGFNCCFIYLQI